LAKAFLGLFMYLQLKLEAIDWYYFFETDKTKHLLKTGFARGIGASYRSSADSPTALGKVGEYRQCMFAHFF
jgi:hypothetical protein